MCFFPSGIHGVKLSVTRSDHSRIQNAHFGKTAVLHRRGEFNKMHTEKESLRIGFVRFEIHFAYTQMVFCTGWKILPAIRVLCDIQACPGYVAKQAEHSGLQICIVLLTFLCQKHSVAPFHQPLRSQDRQFFLDYSNTCLIQKGEKSVASSQCLGRARLLSLFKPTWWITTSMTNCSVKMCPVT